MQEDRVIEVNARDGIRHYEDHLRCIQKKSDAAMQVPSRVSHAGSLGRSVSFAQLIATWANKSSTKCVRSNLDLDRSESHEDFVSRIHGLATAHFADQITSTSDGSNLKSALLRAAEPRIMAMNKRKVASTTKGPIAEFVFIHGYKPEFHIGLYSKIPNWDDLKDYEEHGKLVSKEPTMNKFLTHVLKALNFPKRDFEQIQSALLQNNTFSLGKLLHETFRNTAEHAYLDSTGQIPSRGLRCVLIAQRTLTEGELSPANLMSADHPGHDMYFARLRDRANLGKRKMVNILELSILDSGPGFALTAPRSLGSEKNRVEWCFRKYSSRKAGENSGIGLGNVINLIGKFDGFGRFRTATTEAVFYTPERPSHETNPVPHVADNLPQVTGTVVTIGIPLSP